MPRKKRIWYPGASYHVMSRGNRRGAIFKDEEDYLIFLECLKQVKDLFVIKIHSICLMTNHFHMAVETGEKELWKTMQKLLLTYAVNYNQKYNLTGHLFENRYTAQIIEDERYFLEVSRYIHLNPVKAKMVRDPLSYDYSSYGIFVSNLSRSMEEEHGRKKKIVSLINELVDTDRVLGAFGNNCNEQYRMFVEGKISHPCFFNRIVVIPN